MVKSIISTILLSVLIGFVLMSADIVATFVCMVSNNPNNLLYWLTYLPTATGLIIMLYKLRKK